MQCLDIVASIAYLIAKLVNVGVFPRTSLVPPTQPSFFRCTLPVIRRRISSRENGYTSLWSDVLSSLPSQQALRSVLSSLFSSLASVADPLDAANNTRALARRDAFLLQSLLGPLGKDKGELLDCFSAVALGRDWDEFHARIFSCWAAGAQKGGRNREGKETAKIFTDTSLTSCI